MSKKNKILNISTDKKQDDSSVSIESDNSNDKAMRRFASSSSQSDSDFHNVDPALLAEAFALAMEKSNVSRRRDVDSKSLSEALSITMKNHRKGNKDEIIEDWNSHQKARMRDQLIVLIGIVLIIVDWLAFGGKIFTNLILAGGLVALGYSYWCFRKGNLPHQLKEKEKDGDIK